LPLKFFAAILLVAPLWFVTEAAGADDLSLSFKISPDGARLMPSAPATLTLTVKAFDSQPSAEGWLMVRLDAPPTGRFFSTDFPVIEGSRLLEVRLPIVDGKAEWRQAFPIRGEYRLAAQFAGGTNANSEKVFNFQVHENEQKWLILGGFAVGLFATGVIAGRIFSTPRHRNTAKLGLTLFCALIYCGATAEEAWSQENSEPKYVSNIEVSSAIVGKPARVRWWLHRPGLEEKPSATLTINITHLEKNSVIFSVEEIPVSDEFSLDYQFTDGSEHNVSAIAVTEDGQTVRQERLVSVNAVAPPSRAQLPALALFLFVIFLGLLAGRWSRRASVPAR
jgi:hypothetical protein